MHFMLIINFLDINSHGHESELLAHLHSFIRIYFLQPIFS